MCTNLDDIYFATQSVINYGASNYEWLTMKIIINKRLLNKVPYVMSLRMLLI